MQNQPSVRSRRQLVSRLKVCVRSELGQCGGRKLEEVTQWSEKEESMFLQSGSQSGSILVLNPPGSLLCELKTNRLCEPENNLRTRYIQNRPIGNPSTRPPSKACRLENMAWTSQCRQICIKKDSIAVKRLKSCCGGSSDRMQTLPRPSL